MALYIVAPAGVTQLTDLNGVQHIPDSNGKIPVANLPQHTDASQLLLNGWTFLSQ
jgi:hypothetical protein